MRSEVATKVTRLAVDDNGSTSIVRAVMAIRPAMLTYPWSRNLGVIPDLGLLGARSLWLILNIHDVQCPFVGKNVSSCLKVQYKRLGNAHYKVWHLTEGQHKKRSQGQTVQNRWTSLHTTRPMRRYSSGTSIQELASWLRRMRHQVPLISEQWQPCICIGGIIFWIQKVMTASYMDSFAVALASKRYMGYQYLTLY